MKQNVIPLKFRPDGTFRVLMVSDIQDVPQHNEKTPAALAALIDSVKPDLVVWGGDNCDGRKVFTEEELRDYLKVFSAPMENAGIPWMHVYGNHDHDCAVPDLRMSELYSECPHCISGVSPDGVPGVSNYAVTVDGGSGEPALVIYAFDTHNKNPELRPGVTTESLLVPNRSNNLRKWDIIRFEQIMWYWNYSCELEKRYGRKIPAMAVMHVAPHEIQLTMDNPGECSFTGYHDELMQMGVLNSGVFAAMLQRGDVNVIAAGHSHQDDVNGVFGGIRLCLDGCAGYHPKGREECRGGRVFDFSVDGTHTTHMVTYLELGF